MCLGVPGKIVEVTGEWTADVEVDGVVIGIGTQFLDGVKVGDYVLVHTGFAMEKMDEADALETLKYLKELADGQVS
jgi:hydrogenase expression/formation protein HypC